jgi:putative ABC transport system ATP-binding protein
MALIDLQNVTKVYHMGEVKVTAIKNINVKIEKATLVSFVGPSGSGKSTLLNLIGCLAKPTAGNIYYKDREINALNPTKAAIFRGEHLGFIFQDFNLIPVLTVFENVEYPLIMVKNMAQKPRKERVLELLSKVGMLDQKDKKPNQISGGQKQRVAVARALVTEPDLVLADEPTANLDHKTAYRVIEVMQKMKENYGITFIFSTHDPKVVNMAEIIYTLEDGVIVNGKEDK